jgi:hypothetical protein
MVWLTYVAVKRSARDSTQSLLQPQRWEQSLSDIQHPLPADSLIPMFEGMVDRALSRVHQEAPLGHENAPVATARGASPTRGVSIPAVGAVSEP